MNKPTGNITFLFTDIEGSTKLAQEFPDSLPAALEKHHSILQSAIESNNGFVFKIVGDAFCCAFQKAEDAVKAAVEVQLNLANEKWADAVIKIRIGLHSGIAEWNGKDYIGYITLARTARVMSVVYGEQIIISNDTYELCFPKLGFGKERDGSNISFRDLGERRLKDVIQPLRLFQIVSPGLREDFPPLKTLDERPNNLPDQLTSFIGREAEMKKVKELLKHTHLLTLTGSGGSGKTRLAIQVGADIIDDFTYGVWLVELASISEPALLPQSIMKVFGVKEEPKRSLEDTLCDYLGDKDILIILDNCEHLIEVSSKLTEKLLSNCPNLKIIATSREILKCTGEHTYRVLSLETPDPKKENSAEKLSQYASVRLFVERAMAVNVSLRINDENAKAIAHICYQLDGIPLAIELAAARIKILSVEKIYERLNDRFKLLTGGNRTALPKQQTLRALIDWSFDLLSDEEKILWSRLSVFNGGWTTEAAEEICSDQKIKKEEVLELLNKLTEKSIIIFDKDKERFRILETLKHYGKEKLKESNTEGDILAKHLHYFMKLSKKAEPKLDGSELLHWLEILEAEHGNLESAIEWSIKGGDIETGIQLAGALGNFWKIRGHYSTGRRLLETVLHNAREVSKSALGKALNWAGIIARSQGEFEQAQKYNEISLKLNREIEDKNGIALSLNSLGNVATDLGKYEQAQKFYEECLSLDRESVDKSRVASSLNNLGNVAIYQGYYEQAQKFYEESLSLQSKLFDKRGMAESLNNLGNVKWCMENYTEAHKFYEESLKLFREMGDKSGIAECLNNIGNIAFALENFEQAYKFYEECLTLFREMGDKRGIAYSLNCLGNAAHKLENFEDARKFFVESLALFREMRDIRLIADSLYCLGFVEYNLENYELSQGFFEENLKFSREMGDKRGIADSLIGFIELLCARDHLSRAVILLGAVKNALKSLGIILHRTDLNLHEKIINKLHEKLSNEEFEKYFEEGTKLTLEEACQLAVSS